MGLQGVFLVSSSPPQRPWGALRPGGMCNPSGHSWYCLGASRPSGRAWNASKGKRPDQMPEPPRLARLKRQQAEAPLRAPSGCLRSLTVAAFPHPPWKCAKPQNGNKELAVETPKLNQTKMDDSQLKSERWHETPLNKTKIYNRHCNLFCTCHTYRQIFYFALQKGIIFFDCLIKKWTWMWVRCWTVCKFNNNFNEKIKSRIKNQTSMKYQMCKMTGRLMNCRLTN